MFTQKMNLDLIRTFVIVSQSKDYNEASSKLNINITNVYRHIKSLETIVGSKLIRKDAKNYIELTEDGKLLLEGYEKAYNLLFITEKTFKQTKDLNNGKITIGIAEDLEIDKLNDKIEKFKKKYPNCAFKIINLPTKELYEKLYHYNLDFVIDEKIDNYTRASGINMIKLFDEEYCLIFSKDKFNIKTLKDLNDVPLILPVSTKKERIFFDDLLDKKGINRRLSIETSSYESSLDYAKRELGVALIPKFLVKKTDMEVCDIPISKSIAISYIKENLSPSSQEFMDNFIKSSENS